MRAAKRTYETVLHRVVGVVMVLQHSQRHDPQKCAVTPDQLVERLGVASEMGVHQHAIVMRGTGFVRGCGSQCGVGRPR